MEKFVIVDGNSLINRAFYGLPPLTSHNGEPCGAVYGFVNMILNVITTEKPEYFVAVFDAGKHTFRHDIYADYKGKRDKMPEDLAKQLPILKNLLHAMGIKTIEIPEIEADDIIGSLSRKFDAEYLLVSGDKDLFQLINKNTTVWFTQKGISQVQKLDEATLLKEYGLKPYQIIELKSIMGDSSDNIPGVPMIGQKGATELITQFDNLDNIYAHIEEVGNRYKNKLLDNKSLAYLSHQLATIKLDVDLDCSLQDCKLTMPLTEKAYEIMYDLDFKSILKRKELFANVDIKPVVKTVISATIKELITAEDVQQMINSFGEIFAVHYNNLTLNFAANNTEYILYKNGNLFNEVLPQLKTLFANNQQKICFDAKSLMHELNFYDIQLNNYFDISIAVYIANEMDAEISFEDCLKLNEISTDMPASALIKLKELYMNKLINGLQLKLYSQVELPLVKVLFDMENTGIKIDVEQIKSLSKSYHVELDEITNKIYQLAGEEFNIKSTKQLEAILFDKLKIEYKGKKGTSIEVLNAIVDKHEIVEYIIRYRKIAKLVSTYLDGMLPYVKADGKIHTTFMQRTTSTGRLSSREPNLQNLPMRDDEGRLLRKMFSSQFENGTIISADYNQIELRLMANFSKDANMVADYLSGKDIHSATASKIFDVPISEIKPSMRRVAKSVNFGIIYGISAYGLSQNIGCTPKEAGDFINRYMSIYPSVKEYGINCIEQTRQTGYAKTLMGRIRHVPDINSSNHVIRGAAERVAKNMPLQGSASDIIKVAMCKVYQSLKDNNLKSKLVLQIHDELVIDCCPGEEAQVKQILKQVMESVVDLPVPLLVEVSQGKTLYEAK